MAVKTIIIDAAIFGQIIADLVADREPPIAVSHYRPNRFTTL